MISFEEKFRPHSGTRSGYRDFFNAGILIAMSSLLLPAWVSWGGDFQLDIAGQMASGLLPAAMGFMLALRCGAIDLSIWVVMSATGVLAATMINSGIDPAIAFLAAGGLGLAIGTCNAILVARFKIPSFVATLVVGLCAMGIMQACCDTPIFRVRENAFDGWVLSFSNSLALSEEDKASLFGPLVTVRMLLVAASWAAILIFLMFADSHARKNPNTPVKHRTSLFASLCVSGALAGVSGMCWLLDLGQVAVASRLVDDLTIPTAVILAGGILLAGLGRTMLVGIFLPLALLLTNAWTQTIWPLQIAGEYVQTAALLCMLGGVHMSFIWSLNQPGRICWLAWPATALTTIGLLSIPASCLAVRSVHPRIYFIGLILWACGVGLLAVSVLLCKKSKKRCKTTTSCSTGT